MCDRKKKDTNSDHAGPSEKKRPRIEPPINLIKLHELTTDDSKCIEFAQKYGLLPKSIVCKTCKDIISDFHPYHSPKGPMRYNFRCHKNQCSNRRVSIKKHTWFEGSKISFKKSLFLIYCFVNKYNLPQTILETSFDCGTSTQTVSDYFSQCREVCIYSILHDTGSEKIGGKGCVVEIREGIFNTRKPKIKGQSFQDKWALGGFCRNTKNTFLIAIEEEDRSEENLLSLICEHVEKGSVLDLRIKGITGPKSKLLDYGLSYPETSHCELVPDEETGIPTFKIQKTVWTVKRTLAANCVPQGASVAHLAEDFWRRKHQRSTIFIDFLKEIASTYARL